ncbi:MAG: hypothetical protein ACUZ9M_04350 [Candidatus Scalindua sp.]
MSCSQGRLSARADLEVVHTGSSSRQWRILSCPQGRPQATGDWRLAGIFYDPTVFATFFKEGNS